MNDMEWGVRAKGYPDLVFPVCHKVTVQYIGCYRIIVFAVVALNLLYLLAKSLLALIILATLDLEARYSLFKSSSLIYLTKSLPLVEFLILSSTLPISGSPPVVIYFAAGIPNDLAPSG